MLSPAGTHRRAMTGGGLGGGEGGRRARPQRAFKRCAVHHQAHAPASECHRAAVRRRVPAQSNLAEQHDIVGRPRREPCTGARQLRGRDRGWRPCWGRGCALGALRRRGETGRGRRRLFRRCGGGRLAHENGACRAAAAAASYNGEANTAGRPETRFGGSNWRPAQQQTARRCRAGGGGLRTSCTAASFVRSEQAPRKREPNVPRGSHSAAAAGRGVGLESRADER